MAKRKETISPAQSAGSELSPKWDKWRPVHIVKAWEAIALTLDIEPEYIREYVDRDRHRSRDFEEFEERLRIMSRNSGVPWLTPYDVIEDRELRLVDLPAWAKSVRWGIPYGLKRIARGQAAEQPGREEPTVTRNREIARRSRTTGLGKVLLAILKQNRDASAKNVLDELRANVGKAIDGVIIEEITSDDFIRWRMGSKSQKTAVSALKDRVSRAKKQLNSDDPLIANSRESR